MVFDQVWHLTRLCIEAKNPFVSSRFGLRHCGQSSAKAAETSDITDAAMRARVSGDNGFIGGIRSGERKNGSDATPTPPANHS